MRHHSLADGSPRGGTTGDYSPAIFEAIVALKTEQRRTRYALEACALALLVWTVASTVALTWIMIEIVLPVASALDPLH